MKTQAQTFLKYRKQWADDATFDGSVQDWIIAKDLCGGAPGQVSFIANWDVIPRQGCSSRFQILEFEDGSIAIRSAKPDYDHWRAC